MSQPVRQNIASGPTRDELKVALGESGALWKLLQTEIARRFAPLEEKWSYNRKKEHWVLQLKSLRARRTITYLIPSGGFFVAAFALGDKACAAAHASAMPANVLEIIDSAKKYVEGRDVRLEVRTPDDVAHVIAVAEVKMAN